jgi:hypothetical protein
MNKNAPDPRVPIFVGNASIATSSYALDILDTSHGSSHGEMSHFPSRDIS